MERQGVALLGKAGLRPDEVEHTRFADMRYVGQGHEVHVVLPAGELCDAGDLAERFEHEYDRLYGRRGPRVGIEAITWRVASAGPRPVLNAANGGATVLDVEPQRGTRAAWFPVARRLRRDARAQPLRARARVLRLLGPRSSRSESRRSSWGRDSAAEVAADLSVIVEVRP